MTEAPDFSKVQAKNGQRFTLVCTGRQCSASAFTSSNKIKKNKHAHYDNGKQQRLISLQKPLRRAFELKEQIQRQEHKIKENWQGEDKQNKELVASLSKVISELRHTQQHRDPTWATLIKMVNEKYEEITGKDMADLVETINGSAYERIRDKINEDIQCASQQLLKGQKQLSPKVKSCKNNSCKSSRNSRGCLIGGCILFLSVILMVWFISKPSDSSKEEFLSNSTVIDGKEPTLDNLQPVKLTPQEIGERNYAKALSRFQQKIYKSVIYLLEVSLAYDPSNIEYLRLRAQAYSKLGKQNEALTDLNATILLAPKNYKLYKDRAFVYWKLKKYEHVLQDCKTVGELTSGKESQDVLHFSLALANFMLGDTKGASTHAKSAILSNQDHSAYYELFAKILWKQGDIENAEKSLEIAERLLK